MNETSVTGAFERGLGFRNLGLINEAEAEFRAVQKSDDAYPEAQVQIISILFLTKRLKQAVALGLKLLGQGYRDHYRIVNFTVQALHYSKRYEKARQLIDSVEPPPHDLIEHQYEIACLEARLGHFRNTLQILAEVLTAKPFFRFKSLIDSDLRDFWCHYSYIELNSHEISLFTQSGFLSLQRDIFQCPDQENFDVPDFLETPKKYQHFFAAGDSLYCLKLDWRFAVSERVLWDSFQASRKSITTNFLLIAHGILRRCIRSGIGDCIHKIEELTARGDVFHAREEVMDLLRVESLDPALFSTISQAFPRLAYYLEEIADGMQIYPAFTSHINACRQALASNDIELAKSHFDTIPAYLGSNLAVKEIECRILSREEEYVTVIPIAKTLCENWPEDPVGWGTIASALSQLGHWEESRKVFNAAPLAYEFTTQKEAMGRLLEEHYKRPARRRKSNTEAGSK